MRKPHYTVAERGEITGTGHNKATAKADLEQQIDRLCTEGARGPHIEFRHGLAIVLWADAYGWQWTILDPATFAERHGKTAGAQVHLVCTGRAAAIEDARSAATQRAWTPDADDAALIAAAEISAEKAAELARLFAHYRANPLPVRPASLATIGLT